MRWHQIAFYKFVPLQDLESWKKHFQEALSRFELKGTMLIASEGINCGLAGSERDIPAFKSWLGSYPEFSGIVYKDSFCSSAPYARAAVKTKKEIVTIKIPGMNPLHHEAARVSPEELARWYKEGKEFLILDTRNQFEYELGSFENAMDITTKSFHEFPDRVRALPEDWKDKTIVTFCTGGIRCEKAAPLMATMGFKDVYQLDGGILGYFEKVGGANWKGECFVFDARVALDSSLKPTGSVICPACQKIVRKNERSADSCPHCRASLKSAFGAEEALLAEAKSDGEPL